MRQVKPVQREFSGQITLDIYFTNEAVVQCNVPIVTILLELMVINN